MNNNQRILHLTLSRKWFDMIASGIKKEEYREIKPYWIKRLLEDVETKNPVADMAYLMENLLTDNISYNTQRFDVVRFRNGYAKDGPTMDVECSYVNIDWGMASWGAESGKHYFVIGLGEILSIKNYNVDKRVPATT